MLEQIMNHQILLYVMTALGAAGAVGMLAVHLSYRRAMLRTREAVTLKEKWLGLWQTRDRLLGKMNLLVWGPSLLSTLCLGLALFFATSLKLRDGLPLSYVYAGTAVPLSLLTLRQFLDFSYQEELIRNSLADYILQGRTRSTRKTEEAQSSVPSAAGRKAQLRPDRQNIKTQTSGTGLRIYPEQNTKSSGIFGRRKTAPTGIREQMAGMAEAAAGTEERGQNGYYPRNPAEDGSMEIEDTGSPAAPASSATDEALREAAVERITASIRQTAAAGSHYSKMLTPEEEEIMREIIREFM